jgi:hypothetical protein
VPDPDEQQIARAQAHLLSLLGRGQFRGGDLISGLEPPDAAEPGDVE